MMRAYDNIDDLWAYTLESLLESMESSSRVGLTKEMLGYQIVLDIIERSGLRF